MIGLREGRPPEWLCLCDCGQHVALTTLRLTSGRSQSCGCTKPEIRKSHTKLTYKITADGVTRTVTEWANVIGLKPARILARIASGWTPEQAVLEPLGRRIRQGNRMLGQRFGLLEVIGWKPSGDHARYVCRCDCGEITEVIGAHLRSGTTKSCGCLRGRKKSLQTDRIVTTNCADAGTYFVLVGDLCKIGTSQNVSRRLAQIEAASPYSVRLLAVHADPHLEKQLHKQFAHLREKNEWFRYEADLRDYVDALVRQSE